MTKDCIHPRPTLCKEPTTDVIVTSLQSGLTIIAACGRAGITPRTYHNWYARGQRESERLLKEMEELGDEDPTVLEALFGSEQALKEARYLTFFQRCAHARAEGEESIFTSVETKSHDRSKDWKADAWRGEKMFPHLRPSHKVEHTGAIASASIKEQKEAALLSDDELNRELQDLLSEEEDASSDDE